jgi:hypothetical protein
MPTEILEAMKMVALYVCVGSETEAAVIVTVVPPLGTVVGA